MDKDIVPELLELIEKEFNTKTLQSAKLKKALNLLKSKKVNYLDVNDFAVEVGEILSDVFKSTITADVLPDNKMYYNIAERILNNRLKNNYDLISSYANDVQTILNHEAGLKLKAQSPVLNQDRIDGLVNKLTEYDDFELAKWLLDDPIVNFSQSVVDDAIKTNADFHFNAGLSPKITRRVFGHACEWCRNLAGTYDYHSEPDDIYRRHERCRCTVEYNPKDGRGVQNSHTKKWRTAQKRAKIEGRKNLGLPQNDIQLPRSVSAKAKDIFAKHDIPVRGETSIKSGSTIKQVNIIAGKGVGRQIDDINRLVRENPGSKPSDWQKVTGIAEMSNGKKAEVHWYQAKNTGKIEFKVKRWL
ncbi:hypothetical protein ACYSNU_18480 [Enterococcus sp. LJL120]